MIDILMLAATAAVILSFSYTLGMYLEGRAAGEPHPADGPAEDLLFVFLIPCLNEARVLGATLDQLLSLPSDNTLILVVDDDSDDSTAEIARSQEPRVMLLQRRQPHAREGKGACLNAAVDHLVGHPALRGRAEDTVVVCLLDADGRLESASVEVVGAHFADPGVGAVQVAVRIENRANGLLPRLQDMEFVCYTELFQRCRSQAGIAGLGGNGQFTRLSALRSLGRQPWTPGMLTEDLDLGVRLLLAGWRTRYTSAGSVSQQGLTRLRPLVRQRSRWFQGLLQCWQLIPTLAARTTGRTRLDLLHMLLSPVLLLVALSMTLSFAAGLGEWLAFPTHRGSRLGVMVVVGWYLLTFSPAALFGFAYARLTDKAVLPSVLHAHLFILYGLLWIPAAVRGAGRVLVRRDSWLKTERVLEPVTGARVRGHGQTSDRCV